MSVSMAGQTKKSKIDSGSPVFVQGYTRKPPKRPVAVKTYVRTFTPRGPDKVKPNPRRKGRIPEWEKMIG